MGESRYLRVGDAARYISISEGSLNKDRCSSGKNEIPFSRAGRSIIYDTNDLDQWIHNNKINKLNSREVEK